jgi:predicted nucleic acid-binding protein
MKVIADTCIWSLALRRKKPHPEVKKKLEEIIRDGRLLIMGPIRQEILSGITHLSQFELLRDYLASFEDIHLSSNHFVEAALFSNTCMKKGIQGSGTDFLICAVATLEQAAIYTFDNDFSGYKKYLPIILFE